MVAAVALAVTVAVGLLDGSGWPGYVVGAVLALALWVMLVASPRALPGARRGTVALSSYAVAAGIGVVLGYGVVRLGGGNSAFWAAGFVAAGAIVGASRSAGDSGDCP